MSDTSNAVVVESLPLPSRQDIEALEAEPKSLVRSLFKRLSSKLDDFSDPSPLFAVGVYVCDITKTLCKRFKKADYIFDIEPYGKGYRAKLSEKGSCVVTTRACLDRFIKNNWFSKIEWLPTKSLNLTDFDMKRPSLLKFAQMKHYWTNGHILFRMLSEDREDIQGLIAMHASTLEQLELPKYESVLLPRKADDISVSVIAARYDTYDTMELRPEYLLSDTERSLHIRVNADNYQAIKTRYSKAVVTVQNTDVARRGLGHVFFRVGPLPVGLVMPIRQKQDETFDVVDVESIWGEMESV